MTCSCLPMFMRSSRTRRPEAIALPVISISNTRGSRRRLNPESMKIAFNVHKEHTSDGFWCCNKPRHFFRLYFPLYTTRLHYNLWPRSPRRSACHACLPKQPCYPTTTCVHIRHYHDREKNGEPPHERGIRWALLDAPNLAKTELTLLNKSTD
jgi:hypothetical protein